MHAYNQGAAMLLELSLSFGVLFCQERWLISDQLHKLNNRSVVFQCYSSSAMNRVVTIMLRGVVYLVVSVLMFAYRCVIVFSVLLNKCKKNLRV